MRRISVSLLTAIAVVAVAVCFSACGEKKFKDYEKTETGLYYKFKERNPEGKQPKIGDFIFMTVSYSCSNDSIPKFEPRDMFDALAEPIFQGDIFEAYSLLKEGEEAEFVIKADSFFFYYLGGQIPPFITAEDVLFFTVKMNKVKTMSDFEQEEKEALKSYITENNITVEPTESGLYYIETQAGKGKKVETGKQVKVHYSGKFLDGTVFDSSVPRGEPITFIVGVTNMIPGFVEGVLLMNQGGKAIFILPSDIAYRESHPNAPIPPFTPIMFEVEIVEVSVPNEN